MQGIAPPTPAALAGVRVIEMGQLIAGPFCGKTLGEFGADVVKIEAVGTGDGAVLHHGDEQAQGERIELHGRRWYCAPAPAMPVCDGSLVP